METTVKNTPHVSYQSREGGARNTGAIIVTPTGVAHVPQFQRMSFPQVQIWISGKNVSLVPPPYSQPIAANTDGENIRYFPRRTEMPPEIAALALSGNDPNPPQGGAPAAVARAA